MSDKVVNVAGRQYDLHVERESSRFRSGSAEIELVSLGADSAEIRVGERVHVVPYLLRGTQISFAFDGEIYSADVTDKGARTRARHRDHSMSAPMPGLVLKILVAVGSVVTKGTPLVILEAMKMEHQIVAPNDGTVAKINCSEGQMVDAGLELVELQNKESVTGNG